MLTMKSTVDEAAFVGGLRGLDEFRRANTSNSRNSTNIASRMGGATRPGIIAALFDGMKTSD